MFVFEKQGFNARNLILGLSSLLALSTASGQQPATQVAPLYATNAKYVQGVGPGYWPTAGSGLTLNLASGTAFCGGSIRTYGGGTLTMPASSISYIYLDSTANCAPASNTTGFSTTTIPIAVVTTNASAITSIADDRTFFLAPGSVGGGTVTGVGLTAPAWLTVTGSPITSGGTISLTPTPDQPANQILATPSGSTGALGLRALTDADLPNPYSGVGACPSNQFASALARAAGPSCAAAIVPSTAGAHQFFNAVNATGVFSQAQPACGDLSNAAASCSINTTNASNITGGTLAVPLSVPGSSATDQAQLGSELTSSANCSASGWTGSYDSYTNGSGNTGAITCTPTISAGAAYVVHIAITGYSGSGSLSITMGDSPLNPGPWNLPFFTSSGTWDIGTITTDANGLVVTPASTFLGTVTVGVKAVTPISSFKFVTQDSGSNPSVSISQQAASLYNLFIGAGTGSGNYNLGSGLQVSTVGCMPGTYETTLGYQNLVTNITGCDNTAIGSFALQSNVSGEQGTAVGYKALQANTLGWYNNAFGQLALGSNTTGYANAAFGEGSQQDGTTGYFNSSLGDDSMFYCIVCYRNTAVGQAAMKEATAGHDNTAIGQAACYYQTTGIENVCVGTNALGTNTTGSQNTVLGYNAGYSVYSSASQNVFLGAWAASAVTTGGYNFAAGTYSLAHLTTGTYNAASGTDSLFSNQTGGFNAGFGAYSLYSNASSSYDTAIGEGSLYATTGADNTALGYQSGYTNTTGANNTFVGYQADATSTGFSNSFALGNGATVNASNIGVLGNGSVTDIYFGSTTPSAKPHWSGSPAGNATTGNATALANNFALLTSDFTDASASGFQTITGLSFTLSPNTAQNVPFSCSLMFSQATNVADSFGIQAATIVPTRIDGYGLMSLGGPGATSPTYGVLTNLTSTTATAIVTGTPTATSVNFVQLNGLIQNPSNASTNVINFVVSQATASDVIVVKAGSWCRLW